MIELLRVIFTGSSLSEVLLNIARLIEDEGDEIFCSIWLMDEASERLKLVAAPSLSFDQITDIEKTLVVSPIAENNVTLRSLARSCGMQSCWSTGIGSRDEKTLGIFVICYRGRNDLLSDETESYKTIAQILGLAVEHLRGDESLRRSEAYLSETQKLTDTGTWVLYPDAPDKVYWTKNLCRMFGFDPRNGSPPRRETTARIHPEDREHVTSRTDQAILNQETFTLEYRVVLPNGTVKYIQSVGYPVLGNAGEIVEMIGASTDVTLQHEKKVALEHSLAASGAVTKQLYQENLDLREEVDQASMFEEIVGSSKPLQRVLQQVSRVAPTDSTVLILGETGTGKELIARAIHKRSQRSSSPFIRVNCAAIPPSLMASELFGHERGAFTGALERRIGRFEAANHGTLFLDEVGELPMEMQSSLLRVVQERELERVGSHQSIRVDVRLVTATNRDLEAAVREGTFRRDLFYRLNVFPLNLPPLRDRVEDIPMLVEYLIDRYSTKTGKRFTSIQKHTLDRMMSYGWPGNIRELQNVIERGIILSDGGTFVIDQSWLDGTPATPMPTRLVDSEREMIEMALRDSKGRISGPRGAAARLGVPRQTLESRIRRLHIDKLAFGGKPD